MRISDSGIIELTGMSFHAYHGCLESERREGNEFIVDFKCTYDISKAASSDRIEDAADYSKIYDIVAAQMKQPSNLLEHLASRIADAIGKEFPQLESVEIKVSKKHPPVSGPVEWSSVTVKR